MTSCMQTPKKTVDSQKLKLKHALKTRILNRKRLVMTLLLKIRRCPQLNSSCFLDRIQVVER